MSVKFFKPEDFDVVSNTKEFFKDGPSVLCARLANAKLERDGKVVYGDIGVNGNWLYKKEQIYLPTHKALLIGIEQIERGSNKILVDKLPGPVYVKELGTYEIGLNVCKHEASKVGNSFYCADGEWINRYTCECGAEVKPATYEVRK